MLSEYQKLETKIAEIKKLLKPFPKGTLICARNGKHYKWYHSNQSRNQSPAYIPKNNRALANQLAQKKYLSLLLEDLKREKRAIQFYLDHHAPLSKSQHLLNHPEYQTLLAPYFTPLSKELSEWAHAPYECNTNHSELLLHKSSSGNLVRSKSEAMIDMLLYINQIPFRYECALHLGDTVLFPDFTIRHPTTGEFYYWEHFGLIDNPSYSQNAYSKLQLYTSFNIIPSIHLITTYETKEIPLSPDIIIKIITHYFL